MEKTIIWKNTEWLSDKVQWTVHPDKAAIAVAKEVEIPDRFKPKQDIEGNVILSLDGEQYVNLEKVLDTGKDGEPCLKWFDGKIGCWRTFALKAKSLDW